MKAADKPCVKLTAYNTGFADEAEFDAWVDYVVANIDAAAGFEVGVERAAFTGRGATFSDEFSGATDEQEEHLSLVLADLWERGCAESFEVPS
jgi:hypothetical protein